VGPVVLALVLAATLVLGAVLARILLSVVLAVVTGREGLPAGALRTAAFVAALFAFWSLAPARAESPGTPTRLTQAR